MSWNGMADRRRHRRAAIRICSEFGDPHAPSRIETMDFSAGGFSCRMDHAIEPLTKLLLRFEFPAFGDRSARDVPCEAVVVRCEKLHEGKPAFAVAAAFLGLSPEESEYIDGYVDWHETVMASAQDGDEADDAESPDRDRVTDRPIP